MDAFKDAVEKRDAAGLRTLLSAHPDLRTAINQPLFNTEPAIVFCRRDRAMVDVLLDFGADINARSQFWGRTVGVLDESTPQMRAYLINRGAVPEIDEFVEAVKTGDGTKVRTLLTTAPTLRPHIDRPLFPFTGGPSVLMVAAKDGGRKIDDFLLNRSPLKEQFLAACQLGDRASASKALKTNPDLLSELAAIDRAQIVQAAFSHNLPALELMLNLGFDVNTRGGEGLTPVAHAALRGDVEVVRMLIEHRADLEIRNDYGGTALDSCQWGSLNFRDRNGDYPACAETLLRGGAKLYYPHFGSAAVQAVLHRYSHRAS
jgi:ankyrin repeat protein